MTFLLLLLFGFMVQWQSVAAQEPTYDAEDMAALKQFFMDNPGLLRLWCLPSVNVPDDTNPDDPLWEAADGVWQKECNMEWRINNTTNTLVIQRLSVSNRKNNLEKITLKGFKNLTDIKLEETKGLKELVLEDLPALKILNIKNSEMESLTCTDLPALTQIDAEKSQLRNFTHTNLTALEVLKVNYTQIESLDVSYMSALTTLETHAAYNLGTLILPEKNSKLKQIYTRLNPNLKELTNLEKQYNLKELTISLTGIPSLDVRMLPILRVLVYANDKPINEVKFGNSLEKLQLGELLQTEIDLSNLTKLNTFSIDGLNLKELDLSKNKLLRYISIRKTPCLTRLDLTGIAPYTVEILDNPNLEEIIIPYSGLANFLCNNNPKLSKLKLHSMDKPQTYLQFDCSNNALPFNAIPRFTEKEKTGSYSTDKTLKYTGQKIRLRIPEGTPTIDMAKLGLYDAQDETTYRILTNPATPEKVLESELTVPADWETGRTYTIYMWRTQTLPSFMNKSLVLEVKVGKAYEVSYSAVNGSMDVSHKGEAIASGTYVTDQEELEFTVAPEVDHSLALFAVNNRPVEGVEANQPFRLTVKNKVHAFAICTPAGAPADGSGKGIIAWDMENATIEAKVDGTAIENGALLPSGTVVDFTVAPAPDMGIEVIQLNEEELDVTEWSFSVRIPEAQNKVVPPTILWVKGSADGWKPGDPDPNADKEKYTLTHEAIDGSILVTKGVLVYPSGSSVRKDTELSVTITPDNTKKLALAAVNGVPRTDVEANKPFNITISGDTQLFALCTTAGAPADGSGKGILAWNLENASLEAMVEGTAVANGEFLDAGTIVDITLTPAQDMGMKFIRLNGEELDVTKWSFSIRIPDAINNKVAPTLLWAKGSADGWKPGDPDPDKEKYTLTYEAIDGTIGVTKGILLYPSGSSVRKGTELSVTITPDITKKLALAAINGVARTDVEANKPFNITIGDDTRIFAVCTTEGAPADGSDKGILAWDQENATIEAKVAGTAVANGELLDAGTTVDITITPAEGMGIEFIRLNGAKMDVTQWSFTIRIPDAENNKVAPTFLWAKGSAGGWKPGDLEPKITYHTLKIMETPEAITIDPAVGSHQIEEGDPVTLNLTVDERYNEKYVFLRLDQEYVLVKEPVEPLAFFYILPGITQDIEVEVVVSNTENPDGSSSVSNERIDNEATRVWSGSGLLLVETPRPIQVEIYAVSGRVIARRTVNGTEQFTVDAGIYFVKAEKTVFKIAVNH